MLKSKSKEQVLQGSDSPKVHWKTITETETSKLNSKSDSTKVTTEAESQTTPTAMMNQDHQLENSKPEAEQTTKVVLEKQDMEHSEKEEDVVESKPVDESTNATSENQSNTNKSMFLHKKKLF